MWGGGGKGYGPPAGGAGWGYGGPGPAGPGFGSGKGWGGPPFAGKGPGRRPARPLPEPAPLPFGTPTRSLAETMLRNPHRRYWPEDLLRVHAHWVNIPPGTLQFLKDYVSVENDCNQHTEAPKVAPARKEGEVDCRALLVPGFCPLMSQQHVVRGLELVAPVCLNHGLRPHFMAYGGFLPAAGDASLASGLAGLVAAQCGLQLPADTFRKFVEFEYGDGTRTVFFIANAIGVSKTPQRILMQKGFRTETVQVEEYVVDEEADEAAARAWELKKKQLEEAGEHGRVAEMGERQRVTRRLLVSKQRERPIKVLQPTKFPLAHVLEYRSSRRCKTPTTEFALACDALDEFMRREMALACSKFVDGWVDRKETEGAARALCEVPVEASKRQWEGEDEERKKKREADRPSILAKWREQDRDGGHTDVELLQLEEHRKAYLEQVCAQEDEELRQKRMGDAEELRRQVEGGAPVEEGGKWWKILWAEDGDALRAFQFFDRGISFRPTGYIAKQKVEELMLQTSDQRTLHSVTGAIEHAVEEIHTHVAGTQIAYKGLCTVQRKVETIAPVTPEQVQQRITEQQHALLAQQKILAAACTNPPQQPELMKRLQEAYQNYHVLGQQYSALTNQIVTLQTIQQGVTSGVPPEQTQQALQHLAQQLDKQQQMVDTQQRKYEDLERDVAAARAAAAESAAAGAQDNNSQPQAQNEAAKATEVKAAPENSAKPGSPKAASPRKAASPKKASPAKLASPKVQSPEGPARMEQDEASA